MKTSKEKWGFSPCKGKRLLFTLLLAVIAAPAHAAGRIDCGSVDSKFVPPRVAYCALLPSDYDTAKGKRYPVLYLLHGLGDNHQTLVNTGAWNLIEELQQQKKIGSFVIITPNAGRSFYVNNKDRKIRYEDFLIREFMPAMEKRFRIGKTRAQRGVSGISMGGYGALRTAFKYPAMFSAVSAHSAALMESMPRGAAAAGLGPYMGRAFGEPFDAQFWRANTPFVFAEKGRFPGLKIYFDCGDRDEYGFERGAEALHQLLTRRRVPHEFHIYPGGHSWAYFARHLPESLQFHSRAFGLTK